VQVISCYESLGQVWSGLFWLRQVFSVYFRIGQVRFGLERLDQVRSG